MYLDCEKENKVTPLEKMLSSVDNEISKKSVSFLSKIFLDKLPIVGAVANDLKDYLIDVYAKVKEKDFYFFLENFYETCKSSSLTEKQIKEIDKKLNDYQNYPHLASIIESVLFSRSQKCRRILAYLAANYVVTGKVTYVDSIIIYALKELTDYEIDEFISVFETHNKEDVFFYLSDSEEKQILCFYKLQSLQLFDKDRSGTLESMDNPNTRGTKSKVSYRLAEIISILKIT